MVMHFAKLHLTLRNIKYIFPELLQTGQVPQTGCPFRHPTNSIKAMNVTFKERKNNRLSAVL